MMVMTSMPVVTVYNMWNAAVPHIPYSGIEMPKELEKQ